MMPLPLTGCMTMNKLLKLAFIFPSITCVKNYLPHRTVMGIGIILKYCKVLSIVPGTE